MPHHWLALILTGNWSEIDAKWFSAAGVKQFGSGRRAPQLLQLDWRFQCYEAVGLSFFQTTLAVILQQRTPHLI